MKSADNQSLQLTTSRLGGLAFFILTSYTAAIRSHFEGGQLSFGVIWLKKWNLIQTTNG